MVIRKRTLRKAAPQDVARLAKYLHLHIDGMSARQIVKLVYWRITRNGVNRY